MIRGSASTAAWRGPPASCSNMIPFSGLASYLFCHPVINSIGIHCKCGILVSQSSGSMLAYSIITVLFTNGYGLQLGIACRFGIRIKWRPEQNSASADELLSVNAWPQFREMALFLPTSAILGCVKVWFPISKPSLYIFVK